MNDDKLIESLLKRLDVLINLALKREMANNALTARDAIGFLNNLGFTDTEIANILGRSRSYISSELTVIRKRKDHDRKR